MPTRMPGGRLWLLGLVLLTGCPTEQDRREQLERERNALWQSRDALGRKMREIPPGSRWADHPDTKTYYLDRVRSMDSRIHEIDEELKKK